MLSHEYVRPGRRISSLLVGALLAAAALALPAAADIEPHPGMLQYPDVGPTHVVFVYANDLWIVSRDGGMARPLASPPGPERFPRFSADGQTIAFLGNYEGDQDLYTISVNGGVPQRLTHHPTTEVLADWTPDGDLLYWANGITGNPRAAQLFTVSSDGGLPEKLPVPYGAAGAISPDGTWLAYTPNNRDTRTWKRYRGGMASDIWLFNLETHESQRITDWEGTDTQPMWHRDRIYYLSDAGDNHRLNIWMYDTNTGDREQITRYSEYDVKWPSIGPGDNGGGEIVFQNGPELYLLNLRNRQTRPVEVTIPGARPTLRTQRVDASEFMQWYQISSTGQRALISARGDIWTCPAENGTPRNLTRTSGVAERQCAWSPDGRWIAYFSDATGEYELYLMQSDGKGETKQLTEGSETFYADPVWSPDSERILFMDRSGNLYLHTIESGETEIIDTDPWGGMSRPSWSHDNQWITYSRGTEESRTPVVFIHNIETGERTQVTSGMFPDSSPTFDRKGDWLYFASSRSFQPTYSDLDTTWVYNQSQVLLAVPLRKDVEYPWPSESDEEQWEEDKEDEDENGDAANGDAEDGDDENGDDAARSDEENGDDEADEEDEPKHPLEGVWEGSVTGLKAVLEQMIPPDAGVDIPDSAPYTIEFIVDEDGNISGTSTIEIMGQVQSEELGEVTFDEATGTYREVSEEQGVKSVMEGTLEGDTLSGTWTMSGAMNGSGEWSVTKTDKEPEKTEEARETVEIDFDGFEQRAIQLPVGNANFSNLVVNDKNQLIYMRRQPGQPPSIKLFDINDDAKAEKNVASGVGSFEISGDGKMLLLVRGGGPAIQNASAGGAAKNVVTDPMTAHIEPRKEWEQIFHDAWRIHRDWFYVPNMHGVDWPAIRKQYAAMLDDCVTRDDLSYVIREMISELNIGHAYYFGGDTENQPSENVGMLGVDWELSDGAYRIREIYHGGPWDADARNPLNRPGVDINEGDYLLAVNGVTVDTDKDPWAPFVGYAGKTITVTVSEDPEMNDNDRDVVIEPMSSEGQLRYRDWIEDNRKYVFEQTDGKVGYIYVPNTGINGQSDLVRQYLGQLDMEALIIDERWNGGGQIPTRFIELLNRPVTNYWQVRDYNNMKWPPDAHHGPKCMLINGRAGSGGDMFPWLFKHNDLGPVIGTRTWGGLVGISGNPPLIDGGYTSVPTFGFYEKDGTWGVEGHGVDPDIEVIADPAKMVDGGDPQLDKAIEIMLHEIEINPQEPPDPPAPPDRSGMGIAEEDK